MTDIKPALLTKSEIEWLLGKIQVSKSYEYKIKSIIRNKVKTLTELELPLLKEKGLIWTSLDLTTNGKILTANGKDKVSLLSADVQILTSTKVDRPCNKPVPSLYL